MKKDVFFCKIKTIKFIFVSICVLLSLFLSGCNKNEAGSYSFLEDGVKNPSTIEEYEAAIAAHEAQIKQIVSIESQTGIWYKILGSRYIDKKMYGKALENYQMAIQYYPDNANLYYYVGVCAGYMAKATLDYDGDGLNDQQQNYWKLAENSYLQAINFNPVYTRALHGLSVLYVYELDRSLEAIPYLEKLLTVKSKSYTDMMILARAYYESGDYDKAVIFYDKILDEATDKSLLLDAQNNKKIVLDLAYGN